MIGTDRRDEELGAALDAVVGGLQSDPDARLPTIRRRGAVRRAIRWAAGGTGLAVTAGAFGWTALWVRDAPVPDHSGVGTVQWRTYTQVALDWSLRYPADWHIQPFEGNCGHDQGPGVLLSNIDHRFEHPEIPNRCTGAWDMTGLPGDIVVVDLRAYDGPGPPPRSDTRFPLAIDSLESATDPRAYRYGAPQPRLWRGVVIRGRHNVLYVWFGPDASDDDRTIAARIVSSVGYAPDWLTYAHDALGFTVSYPPAWRGQPFVHPCPAVTPRYHFSGVVISNLGTDLRQAEPCVDEWDLEGTPGGLVVIEIARRSGGPFPSFAGPDTRFPLSVARAKPVTDPESIRFGAPGPESVLEVGRDGIHRFTVRIWYGPEASRGTIEIAQRIVESIALVESAP
jgi:hypothetical protein